MPLVPNTRLCNTQYRVQLKPRKIQAPQIETRRLKSNRKNHLHLNRFSSPQYS